LFLVQDFTGGYESKTIYFCSFDEIIARLHQFSSATFERVNSSIERDGALSDVPIKPLKNWSIQ
jgi:hypothetical protein